MASLPGDNGGSNTSMWDPNDQNAGPHPSTLNDPGAGRSVSPFGTDADRNTEVLNQMAAQKKAWAADDPNLFAPRDPRYKSIAQSREDLNYTGAMQEAAFALTEFGSYNTDDGSKTSTLYGGVQKGKKELPVIEKCVVDTLTQKYRKCS